jgi:N-acetylmuramoyl-L-alanine amidase
MYKNARLSRLLVAAIAVLGFALAIPAANATEEEHTLPMPFLTSPPVAMSVKKATAMPPVQGTPLSGKVILIDAGHGGKDDGTRQSYESCSLTSPNGDTMINEKDITLKIAFKLKADLEAQGATVYMTRETDVFVDLWDRVAMQEDVSQTPAGQRNHVAKRKTDIFISIHVNSVDYKTDFDEIQVYSYFPPGKELSEKIAPLLMKEMAKNTRVINPMDFRVVDHNSEIPTILIETGFITNAGTCRDLVNDTYQTRMAQAIADGVDFYFGVTHPANLPTVLHADPRHPEPSHNPADKEKPAKSDKPAKHKPSKGNVHHKKHR